MKEKILNCTFVIFFILCIVGICHSIYKSASKFDLCILFALIIAFITMIYRKNIKAHEELRKYENERDQLLIQALSGNINAKMEIYKKGLSFLLNKYPSFLLQELIDSNCAEAKYIKARQIEEENFTEALNLYKQSAEQDFSAALQRMGELYYLGEKTEQNISLAEEYLYRASSLGNAEAMFELGVLYEKKYGLYPLSYVYYRLAATYTTSYRFEEYSAAEFSIENKLTAEQKEKGSQLVSKLEKKWNLSKAARTAGTNRM